MGEESGNGVLGWGVGDEAGWGEESGSQCRNHRPEAPESPIRSPLRPATKLDLLDQLQLVSESQEGDGPRPQGPESLR